MSSQSMPATLTRSPTNTLCLIFLRMPLTVHKSSVLPSPCGALQRACMSLGHYLFPLTWCSTAMHRQTTQEGVKCMC